MERTAAGSGKAEKRRTVLQEMKCEQEAKMRAAVDAAIDDAFAQQREGEASALLSRDDIDSGESPRSLGCCPSLEAARADARRGCGCMGQA